MSTKNKTETRQETATLKYGYMWEERTTTETTPAGVKSVTVTKRIARDPQVGFFGKLFRF